MPTSGLADLGIVDFDLLPDESAYDAETSQ